MKDISIQKNLLLLLTFNPGLTLTGFRTTRARFQTSLKKILLKKELPQHWTVTTIRIIITKHQQGRINISEDITIKNQTKLIKIYSQWQKF